MTDRQRLNLRGPARTVTLTRDGRHGPLVDEYSFDREGHVVSIYSRGANGKEWRHDVSHNADALSDDSHHGWRRHDDGSDVEVQSVSALDAWSMDALHGVAFGTHGASFARTQVDAQGWPVATVLVDPDGRELSTIQYVCDRAGRIVEARQMNGAQAGFRRPSASATTPASAHDLAVIPHAAGPGIQEVQVSFEYDAAGRVVQWHGYLAGEHTITRVMSYNQRGDLASSTSTNQEPTRFEYEYDQHDNWLVKRIHRPSGSGEEIRTITYYDDED